MPPGADVDLVGPAGSKGDGNEEGGRQLEDPVGSGEIIGHETAREASLVLEPVSGGNPEAPSDERWEVAEGIDLTVGVGDGGPHGRAPVLEGEDVPNTTVAAQHLRSIAPDGNETAALLGGEGGEASLVTRGVDHELTPAEGWRDARVITGDSRRRWVERGEAVVEDQRVVGRGNLLPAGTEGAAQSGSG
jgi:hypothetical protein